MRFFIRSALRLAVVFGLLAAGPRIRVLAMSIELLEPLGGEVYISGRTVEIAWKSYFDPGESADNLQLFYAWGGESTYHYLGGPGSMADIPQGEYRWHAPVVTEMSYLRIKAGLYREDGPELASDVSLHVKIIPNADTPAIHLIDPQPPDADSLAIPAGSLRLIGWTITGCRAPYNTEPLKILFSANGGLTYEEVDEVTPCGIPLYGWNVPEIETTRGKIKLQWGDLDWSATIHSFTIYDDTPPPQPPVADAGPDQTVSEGARVDLTGAGSSDPEGRTLSYSWERTDPWAATYPVTLHDRVTATPWFDAPEVGPEPKVFTFRLTVEDPDGLTDDDTVSITVNPGGPELTRFSPGQGWFKTPITIEGANLGGCEVRMGGALVATIPAAQDTAFVFYLPDLPVGPRNLEVRNAAGSDTSAARFTVLPVPYQWDWGFPFHNPGGYDLSWADYERAFGTDAVYSWLCCDFELVCRRRCHRVLAQLLYDYYVQTMARPGTCWGVSVASLKYYYGDYSLSPGQTVRHLWFNLDPENDLTRRIKALHIDQISAEVIDYLLGHLDETPGEVAARIMADLDAGEPGVVSIQNISEGMDLTDLSGHAMVPVHYEVVSADETRIYVYDSNRQALSMSRENGNPAEYAAITSWDSVPYIRVTTGASDTWEFAMAGGGDPWTASDRFNIRVAIGNSEILIPFSGFYYFPRGVAVRDNYALPVSAEGLFMIFTGAVDGGVENPAGRRLGFDRVGGLQMDIAGGMPVVPMGGASFREAEAYRLPADDYVVHAHGREAGKYAWQSHGKNGSLALKDAATVPGTHDTLRVGAQSDYLSLLAGSAKECDLVVTSFTDAGKQRLARTYELHGVGLDPDDQVIVRREEQDDSLVVANLSARPKELNLTVTQALLGPQPEPPDMPTAGETTLTVKGIKLAAGAALGLTPADWDSLAGTELKLGRLPDRDGDGLDDAFEERLGTDPNRPDTDKDTLSDGYEFRHGLDPRVAADESTDRDGDGLSDRDEAGYGTDPGIPGGPFIIFHQGLLPGRELELRFNTVPGHTYFVERADAVPEAPWKPAGEAFKTAGWNERFSEILPKESVTRYYRVRRLD